MTPTDPAQRQKNVRSGVIIVVSIVAFAAVLVVISNFRIENQLSVPEDYLKTLSAMDPTALADEKTRHEIQELYLGNRTQNDFWQVMPSIATLLTAIIAMVGAFVTITKQMNENKIQREKELQQREKETRLMNEERFSIITQDLGSDKLAVSANAAVLLLTFAPQEFEIYHEPIFNLLLANTKLDHDEIFYDLLKQPFEKFVRLVLPKYLAADPEYSLDLTNVHMEGVDLSGLSLRNIDLAFSKMKYANFSGADLFRARGYDADIPGGNFSEANFGEARFQKADLIEANFHKSNLVAADLKHADLRRAEFQQAKLQAVHFQGAKLFGAKFEQANLADARFIGSKLDAAAIASIFMAVKWQKAHFDDDVREKLEAMQKEKDIQT